MPSNLSKIYTVFRNTPNTARAGEEGDRQTHQLEDEEGDELVQRRLEQSL